MGKTGDTIFVLVLAVVTTVVCAGASIHFVMAYSMRKDSNRNWWTLTAAMLAHFCIGFPLCFLAVDVLDTQLCMRTDSTVQVITGMQSGCFIPAGSMYHVMEAVNLFLAQFGLIFIINFLKHRDRRMAVRLGISFGWSAFATLGILGISLVLYYTPGVVVTHYSAVGLVSATIPFSANTTVHACPLPDSMAVYSASQGLGRFWQSNATSPCSAEEWPFTDYVPSAASPGGKDVAASLPSSDYPTEYPYGLFVLAVYEFLGHFIFIPLFAVGIVAHPLRLMLEFTHRPRQPLKKADFIHRVRQWSEEARRIKLQAASLDNEAALTGMSGQLTRRLQQLGRQVALLELKEEATNLQYPQRTHDPELTWTFHLLGIYAKAVWSVIATALSLAWLLNVMLFVIPYPPVSAWLNALVSFTMDSSFAAYMLNIMDLLFTQVLTFYVLMCTVCGLRTLQDMIPALQIYPYIHRGTRMRALFMNAWPLLFSIRAILEFVAMNLSQAMARTSILTNIIHQGNYVTIFIWSARQNVFWYALLVCVAISAIIVPLHETRKLRAARYSRPSVRVPNSRNTGSSPRKSGTAALLMLQAQPRSPPQSPQVFTHPATIEPPPAHTGV